MVLYFRKLSQLLYPSALMALALMVTLCTASIFVIISATFMNDSNSQKSLWVLQYRFEIVGILFFLAFALTPYRLLLELSPYLYFVALILLCACFIPGIGKKVMGAYSWVKVAGIGFEPAEFAKITYILALAYFLDKYEWMRENFLQQEVFWKRFLYKVIVRLIFIIPLGLLAKQPAFGSALVFCGIALGMVFASGVRLLYICIPFFLAVVFGGLFYYAIIVKEWEPNIPFFKTSHVVDRFRTFLDPDLDKQGKSWQVNQSVIAISEGGFYGKGWKQGTQNVLGFLPRNTSYNDLIFSVIGEEEGFVGGTSLIIGESALLLWCLWVATHARDKPGQLIAIGVMSMLFTHVFVNIGMTMRLVPIIGIPLPFISYGGTFMIGCLSAMGLVASVWIHRKNYERS